MTINEAKKILKIYGDWSPMMFIHLLNRNGEECGKDLKALVDRAHEKVNETKTV